MATFRPAGSWGGLPAARSGRVLPAAAVALLASGAVSTLLLLGLGRWLFFPATGPGEAVPQSAQHAAASDDATADAARALKAPAERTAGVTPRSLEQAVTDIAAASGAKASARDDPQLRELMEFGAAGRSGSADAAAAAFSHPWEIRLGKEVTTVEYAQQLDFFGIELGVVMPGGQLTYVSGLAAAKPKVRTGPAGQEQRWYLTWRGGEMEQADRELLSRANIDARDRVVLKLLPATVETALAKLEQEHAGPRADRIGKTRFGIRATQQGFAFYVIDQSYR